MDIALFEPRDGGVKIVFDVREADVAGVTRTVAAAGFHVRRYYDPDTEHDRGGSAPDWIRLGAQRRMREFTPAEEQRIVAAFDAAQRAADFLCLRRGTDTWAAGNDEASGVREPRRPLPRADAGMAAAPVT